MAKTHSEMAAELVVQGCLSNLSGAGDGKFPPGGAFLEERERSELGLQPGGRTLFYAIGQSGVYANFQGANTTVWFSASDTNSADALDKLERALKADFPGAVQRHDRPLPNDEFSRERSYDVPLSTERAATVDVAYPAPGAGAVGFRVRVLAYGRGQKTN